MTNRKMFLFLLMGIIALIMGVSLMCLQELPL